MAALAQITALGGDTARRSVSWWLAELRAMLPGQLAGRAERAPAILDVSPHGAVLVLARRGSAPAAELPLGGIDPQEARTRVRAALRSAGLASA